MKKLILIFVSLILLCATTSCSTKFDETRTDDIYVQIVLSDNRKINLELYYDKAPITVSNFIKLAQDGFYEGTIFHRVIEDFMIQGGGYTMENGKLTQKKGASKIKGEFSSNGYKKNNIKHVAGVISMARSTSKNSASSEFFICSATSTHLDGEYAAFGKTTDSKSKQIVINISKVKTYKYSSTFTDMPENVIKIKKVNLSNSKF